MKNKKEPAGNRDEDTGLCDAMNDPLVVVDRGGKLLKVNKAAERLTGIDSAGLVGKNFLRAGLTTPKSGLLLLKNLALRMAGKKIKPYIVDIVAKGGKVIPCEVNAGLTKLNGTTVDVVIFRDVTDRGKEHEELKKAYEELKTLDEMKTKFISILSHELKTPITPVILQAHMLREGFFGEISREQNHSLEIIERNLRRLNKLIGDILDISRIEGQRMVLFVERHSPGKCLREAVESMRGTATQKNLGIALKMGELPRASFDRERIMQVIQNLMNNSIKFTNPGGKITVSAKRGNGRIIVAVEDTGIGINKQDQKHLFSPFFQSEPAYKRNETGTGLGLAICRGIVAAHGGKIWVKSGKGKGTKVSFTLPLKPPKNGESGKK